MVSGGAVIVVAVVAAATVCPVVVRRAADFAHEAGADSGGQISKDFGWLSRPVARWGRMVGFTVSPADRCLSMRSKLIPFRRRELSFKPLFDAEVAVGKLK